MNDIDFIRDRLNIYGDLVSEVWLSDRKRKLNIRFMARHRTMLRLTIDRNELNVFMRGNPPARIAEAFVEARNLRCDSKTQRRSRAAITPRNYRATASDQNPAIAASESAP